MIVRQHTTQAQADASEGTQSLERKRKSPENSLLHAQLAVKQDGGLMLSL